jgi:hypothetical protein
MGASDEFGPTPCDLLGGNGVSPTDDGPSSEAELSAISLLCLLFAWPDRTEGEADERPVSQAPPRGSVS